MSYQVGVEIVTAVLLSVSAVTDWFYQKIWIPVLVIAVPAILYCLYGCGIGIGGRIVVSTIIIIVFWGIHVMTAGQIDIGDGILLGVAILGMELWEGFLFLFFSFSFAFLFALLLVVFRKKRQNDRIPFAPFVLAGYLTLLALKHSI